jgi:hypothetical protein
MLCSKHQDGAGDLAGLHRAERPVLLVKLHAARDHLVQFQAALE